ncbi:MAG: hypothetical protein DHS20C18_38080 [Saprospiraceae bacterium]|nr:MAG: hypothetical protein DHS20C18_38080 [Saprospiraceae bacterium]
MDIGYLHLIVEVSVTVYVFLLGLPVLVNQIFLPEDLRRMSKRNYTGGTTWYMALLTVLLLLIVLIVYFGTGHASSTDLPMLGLVVTVLFLLMLSITLWFLYQQLIRSQGYRARIIEIIRKKIRKKYRQTGQLDRAYLADLEHLGVYSKRGLETQNVIKALEDVLNQALENEHTSFDSMALIQVIETLYRSVANTVEPGSRANMVQVLTIYKSILMELGSHSSLDKEVIFGNATRKIKDCTTKIARTSLKLEYADMMPLVLNVLTLIPGSSDKLFYIGILALENNHYQIATNVLAEIMDRDNIDDFTINNYLGLIAHFYFAGPTARHYATGSLQNHGIDISKEVVQKAARHHYALSDFVTVDRLEAMLAIYPAEV